MVNITKLISSLLFKRVLQVKIGQTYHKIILIISGVPQGAVLSTVLCTTYTADIPTDDTNTKTHTYADDIAYISHSRKANLSVRYLQLATWRNKLRD